jgi:hypothetical protein
MQTFISLPVKDLARATQFFSALGFAFDPQFTDENATRVIVGDDTSGDAAGRAVLRGIHRTPGEHSQGGA